MEMKYSNLEELKRKKALLKQEVGELEALITFENPRASLSKITDGASDSYFTEKTDESGEKKLALRTGHIARQVGNFLTLRSQSNSLIAFDNKGLDSSILETTLKLGSVAFVGNLARKGLASKSWKGKLLGLALVYLLPFALRFVRNKVEEFQKKQSISSMEKLI